MQNKLKFFNTASRNKEVFEPHHDRQVAMYTCGPTVYDFAHIGNFRTYIFEDLLRRTLKFFGYNVKQVMNLTDVDDKTIRGALKNKVSLEEFTKTYKIAFFEDIKTLNIEPVEFYPAATDFIPDMIEMIQILLKNGIAYKGGDGSIYYSIHKFPKYGCLSHLNLDELEAGASERVATDEYEKESVSDFVLWKLHDPERDGNIFWQSPFGPGRPGWHLECSAMAMKILGEEIDIHCGGVDNIFPHHENEIAQSEGCTGKQFVKFWLHSEHLLVNNKKMSKSLGNFYTLRDLLNKGYSPAQIRYMLLQTHYKTQLNFTFEGLDAAKNALERVNDFILRLSEVKNAKSQGVLLSILEKAHVDFANALADDLNISAALAVVFELIREVYSLMDLEKISQDEAQNTIELLKNFNSVLGVLSFEKAIDQISSDLLEALEKRNQARANKEWAKADELRDLILSRGYVIEDTSGGARLKKK